MSNGRFRALAIMLAAMLAVAGLAICVTAGNNGTTASCEGAAVTVQPVGIDESSSVPDIVMCYEKVSAEKKYYEGMGRTVVIVDGAAYDQNDFRGVIVDALRDMIGIDQGPHGVYGRGHGGPQSENGTGCADRIGAGADSHSTQHGPHFFHTRTSGERIDTFQSDAGIPDAAKTEGSAAPAVDTEFLKMAICYLENSGYDLPDGTVSALRNALDLQLASGLSAAADAALLSYAETGLQNNRRQAQRAVGQNNDDTDDISETQLQIQITEEEQVDEDDSATGGESLLPFTGELELAAVHQTVNVQVSATIGTFGLDL
jgi:hypothetical protein